MSQLGYKDSNLEMLESESSALPFGDSPLSAVPIGATKRLYTNVFYNASFLARLLTVS